MKKAQNAEEVASDQPAKENQTDTQPEEQAKKDGEEVGETVEGRHAYSGSAFGETVEEGASLVEEFSPHGAAELVNEHTPHISDKIVYYIMSVIYCGVGLTCIFASELVIDVLSYIVGSLMAFIGVVQFVLAIKNKEYRHTKSNKTAGSIVLVALAVMILVDRSWADSFIPIVWGVIGLFEGAHAFNNAFSRISRGVGCSYFIVKGIIELVLAFLLLYDPVHHIKLHIVVFGANLVFDAITMLPIVKKFTEGGR